MFESICTKCGETYNPSVPGENHFHEAGEEHPGEYQGYWGDNEFILGRLQLIEDFHEFLECELLDEYYARTWEWLEENPSISTVPELYSLFLTYYPDWEN